MKLIKEITRSLTKICTGIFTLSGLVKLLNLLDETNIFLMVIILILLLIYTFALFWLIEWSWKDEKDNSI